MFGRRRNRHNSQNQNPYQQPQNIYAPNQFQTQNQYHNYSPQQPQPFGIQQMPYQQPYQNQMPQQQLQPKQPVMQQQQQPVFQGIGYQIGGQGVSPAPKKYVSQNDVRIEMIETHQNRSSQLNPSMMNQNQTHSHYPSQVFCGNCQQVVTTKVNYELGAGSWFFVICFCIFFWPLMFLPCCCQSMQDVTHYCPYCNGFLGRKKFLF